MKIEQIKSLLQEKIAADILDLPERKIEFGEPLISSGVIDSFSLVDLAMLVEDEFGVIIEDTELNTDNFDDINSLANIILARM